MPRFFKKKNKTPGTPPGTLSFIGEKKVEKVSVQLIDYNPDQFEEREIQDLEEISKYKDKDSVTWINIYGLHDIEMIRKIGEIFELSELLLEDILNVDQRPKLAEYDKCIFIVIKMLRYDETADRILPEQLSIIYSDKFLITFQESVGDVFEVVRNRLRNQRKRIRSSGPDFLAYALVDTIVDNYILIIEDFGDDIESNETKIIKDPDPEMVEIINYYKLEIQFLRRSIRPTKELIFQWSKVESDFVKAETFQYLEDLNDHITTVNEALDTYREMLSDQLTIFHTTISSKMNDIMRVLTIFAAIFIPLTFIAGVYGTNFENLPELKFKYSYLIFWIILIVVALFMLRYFRKKKWL